MKYDIIPFGIRSSLTKQAFSEVLQREEARFKRLNPSKFAVGDEIEFPSGCQRLFGGWEIFDTDFLNTRLSRPLPESAVVEDVFVDTSYAHETVFYYKENELSEIKKLRHLEDAISKLVHDRLYWSCRLKDVPFTWSLAQEFLRPKTNCQFAHA